jgi:KDO2-lipid IV(A) lauroyltransferase
MRLKHTFEYAAAVCALKAFRLLPLKVALDLGEALGQILYSVVGLRRKVSVRNIASAFPALQPREHDRIAVASYRHLGLSMAEFAHMCSWAHDGVRFANLSLIWRLLERGKGVIVVTGHFGNWEALAAASALQGVPLTAFARRQRNSRVSDLIDRCREESGMTVVHASVAGLRRAREALKGGGVVAFLADQDAGRRGTFTNFLGRPASTTPIPVALAKRTGAPLVPGYIERCGRASHRVEFEDPLPLDSSTPVIQQVADSLGRRVRACPEQYFWAHRRWKTRPAAPAGAPDVRGRR